MIVIVAAVALEFRTSYFRRDSPTTDQTRAEALRSDARGKLARLEIDDAEERLLKAVALAPDSSLAHADLAVALAERGNYEKARAEADAATTLIEPLSNRDRAWVLGVAAETHWDLKAAMNAYASASAQFNDGGLEATLRLAHVQTLAGRERDARANLDRIDAATSAGDLRVDYERVKAIAASVAIDNQIRLLTEIAARHPQDRRIVAVALWKECSLLGANNEPSSVDACDRALELFAEERDALGRARVLSVQATLEAKGLGRYANKLPCKRLSERTSLADKAEGLARELQSQIDVAGAMLNRATVWQRCIVYDRVNATTRASEDRKAALKIFSDLGDRVSVAMLQNNWGLLLLDAWENGQARDLFREARDTFRASGAEDRVGIADSNLGKAQLLLGELPGAEASLIEALQIADANQIKSYPPDSLINLGAVYLARGQIHEAELCLQGVWCYPGAKHVGITNLGDAGRWEASLLSGAHDCPTRSVPKPASIFECDGVEHALSPQSGASLDSLDKDDVAERSDICARVLLGDATCSFAHHDPVAGKVQAQRAIRITGKASRLTLDDHRVEISLLTTEARALGLLRDIDTARSNLASAQEKAGTYQLPGLALEVRLAGVELAFRDAGTPLPARTREAELLRADAEKAGFLRMVSRLDALAAAR